MALDPRKQQKKVERRKAKDKARKLAEKQHAKELQQKLFKSIATAPILDCLVTESIWEQGIAHVIISRQLTGNQVAFADFLLDTYCLGVKDVFMSIKSQAEYEHEFLAFIREKMPLEDVEPEFARMLIEGGIAYAEQFGFSPHPDYKKASIILGDIEVIEDGFEFEFGCEGTPYYISGPHDSAERSNRIIHALHEQCGPGGYHFTAHNVRPSLLPVFEVPEHNELADHNEMDWSR
jgi:hypothetical protein